MAICCLLPGIPTFSTAFCSRSGISNHFITKEPFLLTKSETGQRRAGTLWFKCMRRNNPKSTCTAPQIFKGGPSGISLELFAMEHSEKTFKAPITREDE